MYTAFPSTLLSHIPTGVDVDIPKSPQVRIVDSVKEPPSDMAAIVIAWCGNVCALKMAVAPLSVAIPKLSG